GPAVHRLWLRLCRGDGRPFGGRLGGLCPSPLPFRLGFFPLWLLDCCRFPRRRFTLKFGLLEGRGRGLGFQGSDGWAAPERDGLIRGLRRSFLCGLHCRLPCRLDCRFFGVLRTGLLVRRLGGLGTLSNGLRPSLRLLSAAPEREAVPPSDRH